MPVYPYACRDCGYKFEEHQTFDDPPVTTCPNCGKHRLHRVYGSVGVVFKGSGFYRTDSRAGKASSLSAKPSSAEKTSSTAGKTSETSGASASSSGSAGSAGAGSSGSTATADSAKK